MSLTDATIRAAKPRDAAYKLTDGAGMYLLVHPNCSRYWRYEYRFQGKRKTLALGIYPNILLAAARKARGQARELLDLGEDPSQRRKLERLTSKIAAQNTFRSISEEWLARLEREGRSVATLTKTKWLLDFAMPDIGNRPISQISPPELLAVLRKVEARGRYETARRLRSTCGAVFRYAITTARADTDPTLSLRGALITPTVNHRAAVTAPKEVGALLRAIEGFVGQPVTHAALQLAPHVFVRPGELRTAEWNEIDLNAAIWSIPASKAKMRRPHKVPLSHQALAILREVHQFTGNGTLIFPCVRTIRRPLSENTINAALRRLGYSKDEMCAHGFRAIASTLLNECGLWNPDAIERQLAHVESDDVRRAYARSEFWDERVRMMQWWSDQLDALRLNRQFHKAAIRAVA